MYNIMPGKKELRYINRANGYDLVFTLGRFDSGKTHRDSEFAPSSKEMNKKVSIPLGFSSSPILETLPGEFVWSRTVMI